jgi:vitamin B12 transporter
MKRKIFFVAACIVSSPLLAQESDTTRFKSLNEVTVIGTKSETKVINVPKSVTVFTSKDFENLPYQNVADLLSRAEGIFATGTLQNPGALQYLYLRGADARQTLIMIDGVKMSDASTPDNSLDLSEISLANIERIEIVRGSQGTLYGSSAVGGTINIITRKNMQLGFKAHASLQAGTFGSKTFGSNNLLGIGYKHESGFYANADYFNSINDGLNATIDNGTNISGYKWNERDNFKKQDLALKTGFANDGWDINVTYRRVHQENDIDDGAYRDDENYVVNYDRNLFSYGAGKKFGKDFSLKLFGGYTKTDRKVDDDSSLVSMNPDTYDATTQHSNYSGNYLSNEVQLNWTSNAFQLVGGAGFTNEKMNTNSIIFSRLYNYTAETDYDSLDIHANVAFIYARGDWKKQFGSQQYFNIGGGLRFSNHSQFGNFLSFEINPSVKAAENTIVFANFSKGFNGPSLYQLYAPESDFTSGITRGNDQLEAEESFTAELGFRTVADRVVALNASIYHFEVKNYIDYVYLWNGAKPTNSIDFSDYRGDTYLNLGTMINTGFELGSTIFFSKQFEASANVSINLGKLKYEPSAVNVEKTEGNHVQIYNTGDFLTTEKEQKDLNRRPTSLVNANLTYKPTNAWRFLLDIKSVGSRPDVYYDPNLGPFGALARNTVSGFMLVNCSAFYTINKHAAVNLQFNNIFNKQYSEVNGFTTRGRGAWLGVNLSL